MKPGGSVGEVACDERRRAEAVFGMMGSSWRLCVVCCLLSSCHDLLSTYGTWNGASDGIVGGLAGLEETQTFHL